MEMLVVVVALLLAAATWLLYRLVAATREARR